MHHKMQTYEYIKHMEVSNMENNNLYLVPMNLQLHLYTSVNVPK